ncbi:TPA: MMPL family transporter [archaeon]|uniref:Protein-export membrane protein SecF n=1 Tax=Candidatus Naiadarchaeum limnaeum TaxID=2756139 RepID=A0A832UND2_9ARCH|nr:MMPL family transporter [Candidatus Naiadarchaeales archaeon SRR2090153.bin1042]HIK00359.1 MMPL family transporter [Candidatus Naiadarchaeum limnaeum]
MELKYNYSLAKKLFIIPVVIFVIAIFFLVQNYMQTGSFLKKGLDFQGGVQISLPQKERIDTESFVSFLSSQLGTKEIDVSTTVNPTTRQQERVIVSVSGLKDQEKLVNAVSEFLKKELKPTDYSISVIAPALAGTFWREAQTAFIVAFILMMIVVGFAYRAVAPSVAILVSTVYDLVAILGFMVFFDIKLSLATFAALLMVIGYGVDTNIILTEKILKEKEGDVFDRVGKAMRTGLTMSAATIVSLVALFFFAESLVIKQIAIALLMGALADIPNTWILNALLLLRFRK